MRLGTSLVSKMQGIKDFFGELEQAAEANRLLQKRLGGREAFNATEQARAGGQVPELAGMDQGMLALVNRMADTSDLQTGWGIPSLFNSVALPVYEGLKGIQQNTPLKPIDTLSDLGVDRVSKFNEKTTPASLQNAVASILGPGLAAKNLTSQLMKRFSRR